MNDASIESMFDLTTITDESVVLHSISRDVSEPISVYRYHGLEAGSSYEFHGMVATTLTPPAGELLCRFATVNDVHFGETECGRIDDHPLGPILTSAPDEPPYPETMNQSAVAEITEIDPAVVIVKGDLSVDGRPEEFAAFDACYGAAFGDRLHVVRGNHDSYRHQQEYAGDQWIELPGVAIALMDTAIPGATTGSLSTTQLEWLEFHAAASDRPVMVMGHHQQWVDGGDGKRSDDYFGLHPDPSDALDEVAARCERIVAYTAGHTHRHRIRRMRRSGIPTIEIGCTKDFPGTWAEYRVYEGGLMQVVHRISSPSALSWSARCRGLYSDFGVDYATYALGTLDDRCTVIGLR